MFENPRRERQASKKFYNKCSENSRFQIAFRTDIVQKLTLGAPNSRKALLESSKILVEHALYVARIQLRTQA